MVRIHARTLSWLALVALVAATMLPAPTRAADTFIDPALERVWQRTDYLVATGQASRTWYWGPSSLQTATEEYKEATGGFRRVQYFDKARMELTNPYGDRTSPWFVTNGLLVKELVTGDLQSGDTEFKKRFPAQVPVAGDPAKDNPEAPLYATFAGLLGAVTERKNGVTDTIDRNGNVGQNLALGSYTDYGYFVQQTGHNVPRVFWDFMTARGPIWEDGAMKTDALINPNYVMGYPITEAYWTRARVGGQVKDVLVQLFERRVLTFTPSNPAGWQVEMGNVGQHYYRWRYEPDPYLTVSPAYGPPGTEFQFTGFAYQPFERVGFWLTGPDGRVFGAEQQAAADEEGKIYPFFSSPTNAPLGTWAITARGVTSKREAVLYFQIKEAIAPQAPTLLVNPSTGSATDHFRFTGSGFGASEDIARRLTLPDGTIRQLSVITATARGEFSFEHVITDTNPATGQYLMSVQGGTTNRKAVARFQLIP